MTKAARIVRDLLLIAAGILTGIRTPPSVGEAGLSGGPSYMWAALLALGGLAALCGVLAHAVRVEIYGCMAVGVGFAVWAFTAVITPDATLTTYALACVFLSGTAGQFYRIGMITEGRVDRT